MSFSIDDAKELVASYQPLLLAKFTFRSGAASATATLAAGAVSSIAVEDGGENCAAPPHVTIVGDGSGATAIATVDETGVVDSVTVVEPGEGYTRALVVFGDVLYFSTKDVTYQGVNYQGRLSEIDLEAVQMMSESGVDIPPSLTLHVADADSSILLNWEEGSQRGFKGATVELRVVFYDALANEFSTDSLVRYVGICDPATPVDDTTLEVHTVNRLNASRKMLPTELIQKHCWKIRPMTPKQCAEADDPQSVYFPCGITDPEKPFCQYTREGCLASDNLARFAGITFSPPHDGGKGREYTTGAWVQLYNSGNDAKYGEPWPLVLGRGWVECPVLNVRQDGNYTRMDVGLTVGHVDSGQSATVGMKVVVNGFELPPGGYDGPDGFVNLNPGNVAWWNWKGRGYRDGDPGADTDPYGSETTIECVIPRDQAGGESIPQVSVLYTGPIPGQQFFDPTPTARTREIEHIEVTDEVAKVFFIGTNQNIASNDPLYAFTISGSLFTELNGDWTGLIDWTWGPPGTVSFNVPGVADGSATGGAFAYSASEASPEVLSNPAWHLYDVALRSGWRRDELDIDSFSEAAAICEEKIEYESQYGGTALHARYISNMVLRQRRQAAEILRGIRMNMAALLQPNRETGLLSVIVKGTLAAQQPEPQPGSNYNAPIPSRLRNGDTADGYVAYSFDEDNAISVKGVPRPISDTPNRLAFQFQDSENNFAATSLALVESDDVERVGQELPSTVQIDGCATVDQATRLAKMLHREAHRGNPQGDTRGTRWYQIQTSIRAIRVGLGQIAMVTWPKPGLSEQLVRVMAVKGPSKTGVISLTVAIHSDDWYIDSELQDSDPAYSNPRRDKLARASYPVCPDIVAPRAGDPFLDVTDRTFAILPIYDVSTDGVVLAKMRLRSKVAVNEFGSAHPPQIATQCSVADTGGTLAGGLYYLAAVAEDADGKLSPPSLIAAAHMPVDVTTGSIEIEAQWWDPNTVAYHVFAGRTPFRLTHQSRVEGTDELVALTSYNVRSWGCPDQELDAIVALGKIVRHSGITGTQILEVAESTIRISGTWEENALAGRECSVVAKLAGGELPVLSYFITGNTTDGILSVTPDPVADGLEPGDVIVIRSVSAITDGGRTWTDALWENPLENAGGGLAPSEEVGMVARILYGTGAGLTNTVASATPTSHTFARDWAVMPDETSRIIIEEPTWLPLDVPIRPLSQPDPETTLAPTFPIENYKQRTMLIGLKTQDGSGNSSVEALMPVRELYVFGAPETTKTVTGDYGHQWKDMNLLADSTDGDIEIQLLPFALYEGRPLFFKKISDDENLVTILPSGDETIDGQESVILKQQWDSLHIKSNVVRDAD